MNKIDRRTLLRTGLLAACIPAGLARAMSRSPDIQVLGAADTNGVMLPTGFSSRIVARSGQPPVAGKDFSWHDAPDGGACFATDDGGWIYVSNSETPEGFGGAGALRFDEGGQPIDAYAILEGTSRNCAGGATPWGTWLSCEEVDEGRVWECDPLGQRDAVVRPAMGVFNHEAVAVDPLNRVLYLTEDKPDGGLYRFIPSRYPDLSAGTLEVAVTVAGSRTGITLGWKAVPDPAASEQPTRQQVAGMQQFDGGEGIVYHEGCVFFTTKGDDRVWCYDIASRIATVVYDAAERLAPILTGVDNITVDAAGTLYIAEDGGDQQVVVIANDGRVWPVAQMSGHESSEIAGVAFSPDGSRLYFSSQRGETGSSADGITYEITGPF